MINADGAEVANCVTPVYAVDSVTELATYSFGIRKGYGVVFNFGKSYPVSNPPLIAVNLQPTFLAFGSYICDNLNITGVVIFSEAVTVFNLVVMAETSQASPLSDAYGLVTFDSAGNMMFDSRYRVFSPRGSVPVISSATNQTFTVSGVDATTYCLVNSLDGRRRKGISGGSPVTYFYAQGVSSPSEGSLVAGWVITAYDYPIYTPGDFIYGGANNLLYGIASG